jgi:methionyl-tRNA formyltransferase
LRVVFLGTPEIAVPTLERLIAGPHEVVGVVSQPDRGRGRGRKPSPSPVAQVALRRGLPLLRPERVGEPEALEALRRLAPDLGVVVAFGQFIPKPVRELPSRGYMINAHASLLPRYRGAAPIARAILEGERETGISVMRVVREMDAGPVALTLKTEIGARENTAELSARLAELAAEAIARAVDLVADDAIEWQEQDERQATHAAKIEKSDAVLDLRESAERLVHRIHALSPRPAGQLRLLQPAVAGVAGKAGKVGEVGEVGEAGGAQGGMRGQVQPVAVAEETIKVSRADAVPFAADERPVPGTIGIDDPEAAGSGQEAESAAAGPGPLRIATGEGWLVPRTLQRPGGRMLAIEDFLRGFPIPDGARFALPDEPDKRDEPNEGAEAR